MAATNYDSIDERMARIKGGAYKAQAVDTALPEYDYARKKVVEQANQSNQQNQDALQRRFASMGALNSGAAIKQQQLQNDSSEKNTLDALQGVNVQEAQARRGLMQDEANKAYQSQEAALGRGFQAEEGQVGREFQADFQSGEAEKGRQFQKGLANDDMEFKKWAANLSNNTALKQLDLQFKQLNADKYNSAFNASIEAKKAGLFDSSSTLDYMINNILRRQEEQGLS